MAFVKKLIDVYRLNQTRLMLVQDSNDPEQAVPLTTAMLGSGGSDPDSAREATQQQVLAAVQALAPLLGGTDGLEELAATNRDLLANLGQYTDGLENLLTLLNTNTDGIEALLSALGVNDQNVIGKLEAVRALLAATLTVQGTVSVGNFPGTQPVSAAALPLPAGAATQATLAQVLAALQGTLTTTVITPTATASTVIIAANASISDGVNLTGRSLVRLIIGATWTEADITVQTSPDGVTWYDLYDEYGTPYTIKAAASRAIYITPGPLLAVSYLRLRSGTPAAPVAQASAASIVLTSVPL